LAEDQNPAGGINDDGSNVPSLPAR
jgi:hypothetical protein